MNNAFYCRPQVLVAGQVVGATNSVDLYGRSLFRSSQPLQYHQTKSVTSYNDISSNNNDEGEEKAIQQHWFFFDRCENGNTDAATVDVPIFVTSSINIVIDNRISISTIVLALFYQS